jgi:hypothetical protein
MGATKSSGRASSCVGFGAPSAVALVFKYGMRNADNNFIAEAPANKDHHPPSHSTRRIALPSGRSIEVVRFDDTVASSGDGLHVCPCCDSELVQPFEWAQVSDEQVELTLQCPNCNWISRDVYCQAQVAQFEDRLDEGVAAILRDLRRLTTANMADEIERFAAALSHDLILPEDF